MSNLINHKVTASAPSNIAFIKYWGKINEKLRLPANSSISMNLESAFTTTSVTFNPELSKDKVTINNKKLTDLEAIRVITHLDRVRKMAGKNVYAEVISENNFPTAAGIASSASAFAALSLSATQALNLNLSEKELSILARVGSGSACRSIPDGFVEWIKGTSNDTSYAVSLYPANYWDIWDLICIVGEGQKKTKSTEGHGIAESSPFYESRIKGMDKKIKEIKHALKHKDFQKFGEILEEDAINMHTVMMTSNPPLIYWQAETLTIIHSIRELRSKGMEVYFTIDAGPNIHVICEGKNRKRIEKHLDKHKSIKKILSSKVGNGARLV